MKEIKAYIRTRVMAETIEALEDAGAPGKMAFTGAKKCRILIKALQYYTVFPRVNFPSVDI